MNGRNRCRTHLGASRITLNPGITVSLRGLKGSVVALTPGGRPGYQLPKAGVGRGQILGYKPSPCLDIYRCSQTLDNPVRAGGDPVVGWDRTMLLRVYGQLWSDNGSGLSRLPQLSEDFAPPCAPPAPPGPTHWIRSGCLIISTFPVNDAIAAAK